MENNISSGALLRRSELIKSDSRFREAIDIHYQFNNEIYKKQPLFYKVMLQESRFNIALAICCLVFGGRVSSVSEIKALCSKYKIASPNSVIAIVTLLKTTSRIKTWRCQEDRRKVLIGPTPKGIDELKRYMSGAFAPLNVLFPEQPIHADLFDDETLRHHFFWRAAEYLFHGVTFKKMLPDVSIFIDKDGGRMIMLSLYLQAIRNENGHGAVVQYSSGELAKAFFVSRIHVSRIIKAAQDAGYLQERDNGILAISPSFIQLVENYAGLFFAYTTHYLNLSPKKPA